MGVMRPIRPCWNCKDAGLIAVAALAGSLYFRIMMPLVSHVLGFINLKLVLNASQMTKMRQKRWVTGKGIKKNRSTKFDVLPVRSKSAYQRFLCVSKCVSNITVFLITSDTLVVTQVSSLISSMNGCPVLTR